MHRGYPAAHFLLVIVDSTITRRNCDPGPHGRRAMSSQAARPGEREFLAAYRSAEYPGFAVAVDLAIFTIRSGPLCALLVQRGEHPYRGYWALPGGFVRSGESVEEAAWRELAEETGEATFSGHLEQLRTYGDPGRDPRMRVVSVAHVALAASFVEEPFTLADLRRVYAAVWGSAPDLGNFRRKVLGTDGFVVPAERSHDPAAGPAGGRPPLLYRRGPATALHPPMLRPE